MERGMGGQPHKTPHFNSRYRYTPLEWPSQEEPGSGLTDSAPVSDVSAPACTNGVWPPLRPVSVAHKNKPSTMSSSNVQSIDLPMDCTAWRFRGMRQPNGCSTPAPKSSAVKQWIKELAQKKKKIFGRWEPSLLGNNQKPWAAARRKGSSKLLVSPRERRHQPALGLRECRPWKTDCLTDVL